METTTDKTNLAYWIERVEEIWGGYAHLAGVLQPEVYAQAAQDNAEAAHSIYTEEMARGASWTAEGAAEESIEPHPADTLGNVIGDDLYDLPSSSLSELLQPHLTIEEADFLTNSGLTLEAIFNGQYELSDGEGIQMHLFNSFNHRLGEEAFLIVWWPSYKSEASLSYWQKKVSEVWGNYPRLKAQLEAMDEYNIAAKTAANLAHQTYNHELDEHGNAPAAYSTAMQYVTPPSATDPDDLAELSVDWDSLPGLEKADIITQHLTIEEEAFLDGHSLSVSQVLEGDYPELLDELIRVRLFDEWNERIGEDVF